MKGLPRTKPHGVAEATSSSQAPSIACSMIDRTTPAPGIRPHQPSLGPHPSPHLESINRAQLYTSHHVQKYRAPRSWFQSGTTTSTTALYNAADSSNVSGPAPSCVFLSSRVLSPNWTLANKQVGCGQRLLCEPELSRYPIFHRSEREPSHLRGTRHDSVLALPKQRVPAAPARVRCKSLP